jgi:hypothetical protein
MNYYNSNDKKYIKNYRNAHSMTEKELQQRFTKERSQISINSFGGVYSNFLYDILKNSGLNINSSAYHSKSCHYIRPIYLNSNLKCMLFLYNQDIRLALSSQLNRKLYLNYYKLFPSRDYFKNNDSNSIKIQNILTKIKGNHRFPLIEDWLKLIYTQIECWSSNDNEKNKNINYDIIIINMNKLDENKQDLFKYILHNICSNNGKLNKVQSHIMMRLYNSIILNKELIKKRNTKEYHHRFKDEQLSLIEKEWVDKIDKKLIELPDFKIIKNLN